MVRSSRHAGVGTRCELPSRTFNPGSTVDLTPYVGYVAGAMTVISYAPQAVRVWKTHEVDDLSWAMLALLTLAGALWITYGIVSSQTPVILTNIGTTLLTGSILAAKIKYK